MATNFPTSIDALVNPIATDSLATVNHAEQHANANDAIEALEAKVGVTNSAVTSSLDYRVRNINATTALVSGSTVIGHTAPVLITAGVQPNLQILGGTVPTSSLMQVRYNNDTSGPNIYLGHSRSTTVGGHTTVATNDGLGNLQFVGSDGTNFISSASISGGAEGTISTGIVPGRLIFSTANSSGTLTERMRIDSDGNVGVGATPSDGYSFFLGKPITGLPTSYGFVASGTVQSDVTSGVNQFISGGNTATAAFTLGSFNHFSANGIATPGAGSTITTQNGFYVFGTTTGALNNFAFRGLIPTGANNNWNLYMDGTAPNYMLGRLAIGTTTGGAMLRVQNDTAVNATVVLRNAAGQSGYSLQIVDSGSAQIFGIGTTGNVGIGTVLSTSTILRINKPITGGTNPVGYYITSAVDGDIAGLVNGIGYISAITASGSTAVPELTHLVVTGGTSTTKPTVQNGFVVAGGMTDGVSNRGFVGQLNAATDRWNLYMSGTANNYLAGNTGIGVSVPTSKLHVVGSFSRGAPVTETTNFTVVDTDNWLICNGTATITATLPAASTQVGREITIKTIAAFTVVSASSNIVPLAGGAAGTAILPATAGAWAKLVSDGTNWIIMQS